MPASPDPDDDSDLADIVELAQAAGDKSLPPAIREAAAAEIRNISDRQQ